MNPDGVGRAERPRATIPVLPESAPFSGEQRAWLNGFLAGLFYDQGAPAALAADASPRSAKTLLLGYGSQSGSAEGWAKKIQKEATPRGFQCELRELNAISSSDLRAAERLVIVTSTWGDGDPPDNATTFWSALSDPAHPALESLEFAVLGFGDRNYSDFCGAARKVDERLVALGARRLVARLRCSWRRRWASRCRRRTRSPARSSAWVRYRSSPRCAGGSPGISSGRGY